MKIIEKTRDPGGKWVVRVLITTLKSEFFIFDHDPVDAEVETVVNKYIANMSDQEYDSIKPYALKLFENEYFNFIKNEWNTSLKTYGIIPPDFTITIENTNEVQNIGYLLVLKRINKQEYYNMSGEFDRYKRLINDNGGIMSRVKFHNDI